MNESSSKYVDKLAMEKIITERLSKVSHSPVQSQFKKNNNLFKDFDKCSLDNSKISISRNGRLTSYIFPSFKVLQDFTEDNSIYLNLNEGSQATSNILLLHGLFDYNITNYSFLIRALNEQGFNVFLMTLPFHFQRKPAESLFSGEYFLSADIYRSQYAYCQAVFDIEASMQLIGNINNYPTIVAGFSMGGCIALRYYILKNYKIATFLANPVTDLSNIIWENPLLTTVLRDIENSGIDKASCKRVYEELDPCKNLEHDFDDKMISMGYSLYDQIIDENSSRALIETVGLRNVNIYNAGHLNVLRVPKLSRDIFDFFQKVNKEI